MLKFLSQLTLGAAITAAFLCVMFFVVADRDADRIMARAQVQKIADCNDSFYGHLEKSCPKGTRSNPR